jgi:hypothetical protein
MEAHATITFMHPQVGAIDLNRPRLKRTVQINRSYLLTANGYS